MLSCPSRRCLASYPFFQLPFQCVSFHQPTPATCAARPPQPPARLPPVPPAAQQPCFSGPLLPELANLSALTKLDFYSAALYGTLPAEWGAPGAFPVLSFLRLSFNNASGTLPPQWGSASSFPALRLVGLHG